MRNPLLSGLAWLSLSLAACNGLTGDDPSVGGAAKDTGAATVEGAALDATVALVNENYLRPGNPQIYCSGVLVAPRVVLTAAHCVTGANSMSLANGTYEQQASVYVGPGSATGKLSGQYKVEKAHVNPYWSFFSRGWKDVAVLVLDKPVEGVTPARLFSSEDGLAAGARTLISGYGVEDMDFVLGNPAAGEGRIGKRHLVDTVVPNGPGSHDVAVGDKAVTCLGDSGGPAYVVDGGQPRVYGLVSYSNPDATKRCSSAPNTIYTLLTPDLLAWAERAAAESGITLSLGGPARETAPSYSDAELDGVAESFTAICDGSSGSPLQQRTARAMASAAGTDCAGAKAKLLTLSELDLTNQRLVDLSPLAGFRNLTKVGLSANRLADLSLLARRLPSATLAIDANYVADLGPFAAHEGALDQYTPSPEGPLYRACKSPANAEQAKTIEALFIAYLGSTWHHGSYRSCEMLNRFAQRHVPEISLANAGLTDLSPLADANLILKTLDLSGNPDADTAPLAAQVAAGLVITR